MKFLFFFLTSDIYSLIFVHLCCKLCSIQRYGCLWSLLSDHLGLLSTILPPGLLTYPAPHDNEDAVFHKHKDTQVQISQLWRDRESPQPCTSRICEPSPLPSPTPAPPLCTQSPLSACAELPPDYPTVTTSQAAPICLPRLIGSGN